MLIRFTKRQSECFTSGENYILYGGKLYANYAGSSRDESYFDTTISVPCQKVGVMSSPFLIMEGVTSCKALLSFFEKLAVN